MTTNPFTQLENSGWILNEQEQKKVEEIKEIDRLLLFLDSIKIETHEKAAN